MKCAWNVHEASWCFELLNLLEAHFLPMSGNKATRINTNTASTNVSSLFLALIKYFTGSHPSNLRIIGEPVHIHWINVRTAYLLWKSAVPSTIPLRQNHFILAPVEHHSVLQVLSSEIASLIFIAHSAHFHFRKFIAPSLHCCRHVYVQEELSSGTHSANLAVL